MEVDINITEFKNLKTLASRVVKFSNKRKTGRKNANTHPKIKQSNQF